MAAIQSTHNRHFIRQPVVRFLTFASPRLTSACPQGGCAQKLSISHSSV